MEILMIRTKTAETIFDALDCLRKEDGLARAYFAICTACK
jgi:hypothetical protein